MSLAYNSSYQSIQKLTWLKNTASINYMASIHLYFIGSKNILARFPHADGLKLHKQEAESNVTFFSLMRLTFVYCMVVWL
jgi:hypothetical protein